MKATMKSEPQPEPLVVIEAGEDDPIPFIIEVVKQPVARPSKSGQQSKGVDLSLLTDELRQMLCEAHTIYMIALDDWETKADPNKPKKKLEDNWDPDESGSPYDYGDDTGQGFELTWGEWWERFYERGRGNPGGARTKDDLPVAPLHPVYTLVRRWWLKHVDGKGFRPDYPRSEEGQPRRSQTDLLLFNPAGRLLLLVVRDLDGRYTADICANLYDAAKRRRRRARSE